MAWHVVIAGGGFGGFYAARTLERVLPPQSTRVTLVSDVNFMLYTPLLPGAAAGTLEPRHVVVPLREALDRTDLRIGAVVDADPDRNIVRVQSLEGHVEELAYDQLVVAIGSVSRTLPVPGLAEHGLGFKSLPDAIMLRNRLIRTLEAAETLEDPAERRAWLSYIFVGAGYAGLEGLAELQDFAADAIERYPRCRTQGMRWILVEATDRVMPEISPDLADFAVRELRRLGRPGAPGGRDRDPHEDDARRAHRDDREAERRRGRPHAHVRVDRRGAAASVGREARPATRRPRPNPRRRDDARRGVAERLGDRRRRGRARPGEEGRDADASDGPARVAPGAAGGAKRRRDARQRPRAPVHVQDEGRVRRHGPGRGGRRHHRHQVARAPGVAAGPHVPPRDDAGDEAQAAPARRLERPARVRARPLGTRPARSPRAARPADRGRHAGRRAPPGRRLMRHDAHGWWIEEAGPPPPLPPLAGDVDTDVVVIGGG